MNREINIKIIKLKKSTVNLFDSFYFTILSKKWLNVDKSILLHCSASVLWNIHYNHLKHRSQGKTLANRWYLWGHIQYMRKKVVLWECYEQQTKKMSGFSPLLLAAVIRKRRWVGFIINSNCGENARKVFI